VFASALGKLVGENVLSGVREIGGEDAKHLQNFFQKLGFTPQKSASLIKDLKNGEYDKVWREAGARIARMPQGSSVEVKSAELKALSEVMNLSGKSEARLIGLLSGAAGGRIGKREMRLLVATLAQEAAEQGAGGVKKIEALREILAEAFKLARDREEAMKNSDAENDGRTRTYKVLAEESRKSRESGRQSESGGSREGEVASRWLNDKGGGKSADKAESADKAADGEKGEASRARGGQRSEGAAAVKGKTSDGEKAEAERFTTLRESKSEAASNDKGESRSRSYGKDGKDGKDGKEPSADDKRAMREFLAKIGRENAENNAAGREGARIDPNAVADKAAQAAQAQNKAFEVLHQAEQGSPRHILRQVQTGMFRAVSAGRQQLTLRLDPPDLGKVHLMLQVTRNEVNAVIRAENPGAARMVADQLAQIKASLEAQGLRVGKLEVQTQTQQQNPNQQQFAWEGAEQHNQARENGQKSGFLGRWARGGKGGEALAREMQNPQEPARNSREGLDIFA
jgi:flagellar hook-length control protein FliK